MVLRVGDKRAKLTSGAYLRYRSLDDNQKHRFHEYLRASSKECYTEEEVTDITRLPEWKRQHEEKVRAEVEGRYARGAGVQVTQVARVDHVPFDNLAGEAARDGGFNEVPTFFTLAFPIERADIVDINGGPSTPVIQLIANPPSLRASGFDLCVDGQVRVVRSGLRRACVPGVALLELHRSGTLIFISDAWSALCWGESQRDQTDPLRINPLGLAETTYNFVELARCIFEHLRPPSQGFGFDLGMWRMEHDGHRASLGPGSLRGRAYQRRRGFLPARDSSHVIRLDWPEPAVDVGLIVYRLLEEFYAWFRMTADEVPYTSVKGSGQRRIDAELLKTDW